ncbi:MAG TPA: glycosyltransferase family 2 protein [Flavisolibacter sp.]|nr:glycosyltransferase family 2 protein [Flavisolibacter sp.]
MPAPSVAIVILNWNGRSFLERFLPSVLATAYDHFEVIVADNASTDDSLVFLEEQFPQVRVIRLSRNFGFARGYNEALKQVQSEYYVLLNSDVEVTPGWLSPMVALLERDPAIASCQPKILAYKDRHLFEYAGAAGGWIDAYGYPFSRGRIFDICETDQGQYNDMQEIFWSSGAAMLVRSNLYHKQKGLDEYFFAHQEEIDLCWRFQLAGYKICCCPQAVVYHVGGGTLPKGNSRKTFLNYRNNLIMLAKNMPLSEKAWKIPYRIVLDLISGCKSLISGDAGYFLAVIKAHLAFTGWLLSGPVTWKPAVRRPLKELRGVYPGTIVFQYFLKKKRYFSDLRHLPQKGV